jgi:hypothetical protein
MTTSTPARPRSKSRATRAAAENRANLTVVPDPPADPQPAPAPVPDPLVKLKLALGTGHTDTPPDSVTSRAAQAATTDAAKSPQAKPNAAAAKMLAQAQGKTSGGVTVRPPKQPKAAKAAKAPKATGKAPDAKATFTGTDRYVGTVTVMVAGEQPGSVVPKVHVCPHEARNGHITDTAALSCAAKMAGNYTAGVAGSRTRGEPRYWGQYQADAEGSQPVGCGCRFGHRSKDSAVTCAKAQAAAAGLTCA